MKTKHQPPQSYADLEDHMPLVISYINRRYFWVTQSDSVKTRVSIEDLYQEGYFALRTAFERYDSTLGAWGDYATQCIFNRVSKYVAKRRSHLTVSAEIMTLANNGNERAQKALFATALVNNDTPAQDPTPCHEYTYDNREIYDRCIGFLTKKQGGVLDRCFHGYKQREIAAELGISASAVGELKRKAEDNLRKQFHEMYT